MNYYPFHIGDYVSATRHLSWEEDAAFRRLLDTYYVTEKPLPADVRAVCRLVMAQTESQREAVRVVLDEFFVLGDAGWINKRAEEEIAGMRSKQQKQRDKANKRWKKPSEESGIAAACSADAAASKNDADAMPPTPTPICSEAKASDGAGAPAPVDNSAPRSLEDMAKAELWRAAVSVLEAGGCPASQCRTFMGKLVQDYTLATVRQAVAAAVSAQPTDAREYLKATCQRLKGERREPLTVESDAARKTALMLAERSATSPDPPPESVRERLTKAKQAAAGASLVVVASEVAT